MVSLEKRPAFNDADVQRVVRAYIECALWSGVDDEGEPLDRVYTLDDIAPDAEAQAWDDCDDFVS